MAKQPTPTPTAKVVSKKHLARLEKERIQTRYLITGTIIVAIVIVALILYGVLNEAVFKQMRPVAQVGSANISTADFQKQVKFNRFQTIEQLRQLSADPIYAQFFGSYIQQLQAQLSSPNAIGQQVLDTMVEDEVVRQEAQKRGITVTEQEVDKRMEEAFGFFPEGTPTATPTTPALPTSTLSPEQTKLFPPTSTPEPTEPSTAEPTEAGQAAEPTSEATTEPTAAATAEPTAAATAAAEPTAAQSPTPLPSATPYTQEGYEKTVNDYSTRLRDIGFSKSDLRTLIRKELLKQKVYEAVTADVKDTAEQVWVRHILVDTAEEAKVVQERLKAGENFTDLAKELSKDSGSAANGGEYDWYVRGKMVEEFDNTAFSLKIGEISQPVKTDYGYHIIQLLGKEDRQMTTQQKDEAKLKVYQDWLEKAKTDAVVKTYDWASVVPEDPAVPPELMVQQQPQSIPDSSLPVQTLPEEPSGPQPEATAAQ